MTQLAEHPMKKYRDLCNWAGLPVRTMSLQDCYLAAGQIIQRLSPRCHTERKTTQQLVEAMNAQELHDLRLAIKWDESLEGPKATSRFQRN
jgi:hypothetical protein